MITLITSLWRDVLRLLFQRPKRLQVAALCYRGKGDDMEVLLITSRDTGRWIIPKGWPISGLETSEAALQEAWEEAGVRNSKATPQPIGTYTYDKILRAGLPVPVETLVYPVKVKELSAEFPEAGERQRKWMSPEAAADLVKEGELKEILRRMTNLFPQNVQHS
ncbi:NUDIX hydrolase [Roseobacter sp. CCS2]|uniref:NUDIX hydrolase n=1 Tax=Roseobacter sp. CCS2 TaxID=391593 RepID=UPI0000F3F13A|nr:NUDIX hydrolase [Roseobacter sp. CCS2]EBA11272.1 NUDIX hydrolase [Roseobacter sp. CCS2]